MIIFELDVNVKPKTVKYEDRVIRFISCTIHHVYAKDYNFALIIAAFVLTRIKGFANEDDRIYTYKKSLLMTETENNDINKFRYDLVQELWKDKFSMFNKKDNAYVHNKWDDLKISSKNFKFLTTFSQFEDLDPNDFEDIQELGEEFGGFSRMFRVRHTGANNTMVLRVYDINYCKRVQGDTADIEFRVSLSKLIECFCRAVRAYVHVGNGPTGKYARYNLRSHRFPYIPILYKCGSIKFDDLSNVSGFYCLEEDFENFMLESRRRKGKIVQLADESLDKLHEVGLVIGSLDKSNIIYDGSKIIFNDLSFAGILESSSRDDDQDEDEDIVRRGSYSLYDEASYIYEAIEQIFSEA
ncbi:uncharacterized protein RJT21DRAFT_117858 [Scheffersomyces amazonensis]|uniref:uncharacterized protein n=1 Tax=Scheffersomyces amazonensis TaxID=1078765 RepID=UPI00315DCABD